MGQNREFLECVPNQVEDGPLLLIQYKYNPKTRKQKLSTSWGVLDAGVVVFSPNSISTQPESSGSPVILMNQKVVAIHRFARTHDEKNLVITFQAVVNKLNGGLVNFHISTFLGKYQHQNPTTENGIFIYHNS